VVEELTDGSAPAFKDHLGSGKPPKDRTKARKHGKNMRRLLKLVSAAFNNPRELLNLNVVRFFKIFSLPTLGRGTILLRMY
jgi:hypothetical protein